MTNARPGNEAIIGVQVGRVGVDTYPLQAKSFQHNTCFYGNTQLLLSSLNQCSHKREMGDHAHTLAGMDLAAYQTARADVCMYVFDDV